MDVKSQGRKIRFSSQFAPAGLNVNFTEEKSGKLFVRTYERGVEDETLSCGTGVTAAALAWAEKKQLQKGSVKIITRGGEMQVNFNRNNEIFTDIYLSGPAKRVFEGETWVLI
jgi:diaminopimelate epimerase